MVSFCMKVSDAEENATTIVYLVSALLSVIGSLITIIAYFLLQRRKQQLFYRFILYLSVTDLLASLGIAISQILIQYYPSAYNIRMCIGFRAFVQYFITCSFFWTTVISVHLYRAIRQLPEYNALTTCYHVVSWGVPAIFMAIILGTDQIVPAEHVIWCNLTPAYEWALWFSPMIASVTINIILYFFILKAFKNSAQNFDIKRQLTLYVVVFVVCWIWDVVDHIITLAVPHCSLYWLWILQDFFSPLQGFLNFVVYGVSSRLVDCNAMFSKRKSRVHVYRTQSSSDRDRDLLLIRSSDPSEEFD